MKSIQRCAKRSRPTVRERLSLAARKALFLTAQTAALIMLASAASVYAQSITIDAGAQWSQPTGSLSVADGALDIRGKLSCGDATVVDVNRFAIAASGEVLNSGACRYAVADVWDKQGAFVPGASTVRFAPTAPNKQTQISGQTNFRNLIVDTPGAALVLPAGVAQRVSGTLTLRGAAGTPVAVRSNQAGSAAAIELDLGGQQNIAHVAVSDVHATGAWLAANQTNEGGSGNARRWFGIGSDPVPLAQPLLLLLFAIGVALIGAMRVRGQRLREILTR